jgi:hypothetical protein
MPLTEVAPKSFPLPTVGALLSRLAREVRERTRPDLMPVLCQP